MDRKSETLVVDADGTLRIPAELLERAHLAPGAVVEVAARDDGSLAIAEIDEGSEEWHAGVLEALAQVAEGKAEFFGSDEEFRSALLARMNAD